MAEHALMPEPTQELRLDHLPSLGKAYGRALLTKKRRRHPGEELPRLMARIDGLTVHARDLQRYREVCQFAPTSVLPPTYPQLLATPLHAEMLTSGLFPLPVFGLIHRKNRIVEHRPIPQSATMSLACRIGAQTEGERGLEFEVLTTVEVGGTLAWEAVSTILAPAGRLQSGPARARLPAVEQAERVISSLWHVPGNIGRRYARVSGDYNPIHLFGLTARLFGFARPIAHGNWSLARAVAELQPAAPPLPRAITIDFKRPVLLPAVAELSAIRKEGDGLAFVLRDASGAEIFFTGSITTI
jgi:acyl dehydratase